MADNSYAVSNLQQVKENIMAYASYAEGHQYSPLYEKIEEAQDAVQRLIDAIEGKEPDDDETPEEVREALEYVREQIGPVTRHYIRATVTKNMELRLPSHAGLDDGKITDLLEEYGSDNDLPEGWWESYGEMDDWLTWV